MAKYTLTLDETKSLFTPEQTTEYESYFALADDIVLNDHIRTAFNMKYRDYEISSGTPQGFLDDMHDIYARYRTVINSMFKELASNGYFASTYQDSEYTETRTPNLTHTRTPNLTNTRTPDLTNTRTPDLTNTRTPDLTSTRTPDLTDTHTPNISTNSEGSQVFSDTPDSSGVITGSYASTVTKNDSTVTSSGTDTTHTTGSEATTQTGKETTTQSGNETTKQTGNETTTQTGSETTKETGTDSRTYTLTKGIPHGSVWDLLKEEKRSLIDTVLSYYAPCFILLY